MSLDLPVSIPALTRGEIPRLRQQQVKKAHLSCQAEQGDQVGRIGPRAVPPTFNQPNVYAESPGQGPPGQPRCCFESLQPLGKFLREPGRLQPKRTPDSTARSNISCASRGLVRKPTPSGTPASRRRSQSSAHTWGRYNSRSSRVLPLTLA